VSIRETILFPFVKPDAVRGGDPPGPPATR
jgi:hypothetical protein